MKEIALDEFVVFERPIGYIPGMHLTIEGEIRDILDKDRRLVAKIIKFDGYRVWCSKKIRNKKTYKKFKEAFHDSLYQRITLPKQNKEV